MSTTEQRNELSFWGWGENPAPSIQQTIDKTISRIFSSLGIHKHNADDNDLTWSSLFSKPKLENIHIHAPRFPLQMDDNGNDNHERVTTTAALGKTLQLFCTANKLDRLKHSYGRSVKDYCHTIMEDFADAAPDYVAYPKSEHDIQLLIEFCDRNRIQLLTYGGGTSVVSGFKSYHSSSALPSSSQNVYNGVIVCNVSKHMHDVLSVCETDQTITVRAGMTSFALEKYLKRHYPAWTLRHFPQSFEFASFGGMLVTKSGGHFAVGNTRLEDFVQCAAMLTPAYGRISVPAIPSSGSGPNILQCIFNGSEGAFGIVTELTLKLLRKPLFKRNVKMEFVGGMPFMQCAEYVREIVQCGIQPSNCRLIAGMEAYLNGLVHNPSNHALIIGFESHLQNPFDQEIANIEAIMHSLNARGEQKKKMFAKLHDTSRSQQRKQSNKNGNPEQSESKNKSSSSSGISQWSSSFIAMPYIRDYLMRTGMLFETFETCVKWSLLPVLHEQIQSLLHRQLKQMELFGNGTTYLLTQRLTHVYIDGACIYYTLTIDPRKMLKTTTATATTTAVAHCESESESESDSISDSDCDYKQYLLWMVNCWSQLKHQIQECLVLNGASATHHHAVGRDHSLSYVKEVGEKNIAWLLNLKKQFDPNWILNPGILLPYLSTADGFIQCKL